MLPVRITLFCTKCEAELAIINTSQFYKDLELLYARYRASHDEICPFTNKEN